MNGAGRLLPGGLLVLALLGCSCTPAYWADRRRDAADVFTATAGVGFGVKVQAGAVEVAPLYFYMPMAGWHGGEWYEYRDSGFHSSEGNTPVFPFPFLYCEGMFPSDRAAVRGKAYSSFGMICFSVPIRYVSGCCLCVPREPEEDEPYPFYKFTDINVVAALGLGMRVGFNPGELADFLLGFTTLDFYGDDIGLREVPKRSSASAPVDWEKWCGLEYPEAPKPGPEPEVFVDAQEVRKKLEQRKSPGKPVELERVAQGGE